MRIAGASRLAAGEGIADCSASYRAHRDNSENFHPFFTGLSPVSPDMRFMPLGGMSRPGHLGNPKETEDDEVA
jgi:hypothetical protein